MSMVGEILDEMPVEVGEPQKGLDLFLVLRYWPIHYTSHIYWVYLDCSVEDDKPKVFHIGLFELTPLRFEIELVLAEMFWNQIYNMVVLLYCLCKDQDIIKVYIHYFLYNEVIEDIIHHDLECSWTVGKAKEHN